MVFAGAGSSALYGDVRTARHSSLAIDAFTVHRTCRGPRTSTCMAGDVPIGGHRDEVRAILKEFEPEGLIV